MFMEQRSLLATPSFATLNPSNSLPIMSNYHTDLSTFNASAISSFNQPYAPYGIKSELFGHHHQYQN
jgi:hypothetical protein